MQDQDITNFELEEFTDSERKFLLEDKNITNLHKELCKLDV